MDKWEAYHVCSGRSLMRLGEPDLEGTPRMWREVWSRSRDAALAYWVEHYPGTRPAAWWIHDNPAPRLPGESEVQMLDRLHLLSDHELVLIRRRAAELLKYPEIGRDLPDWQLVEFLELKGTLR